MKSQKTHGGEPLSAFTLIVIGVEMLAIAAIVWHACTDTVNARHPATWFGEHTVDLGGPKGK